MKSSVPKFVDFKELLSSKKLFLSNEPYVINKDRLQGERELADIVNSAECEGVWVYSHHDSYWWNIGFELYIEKQNRGIIKSAGVRAFIFDCGELGDRVTNYHIHPLFMERIIEKNLISKAKKQGVNKVVEPDLWDKLIKFCPIYAAVVSSIPSEGDIKIYITTLSNTTGCHLDFKIVSPHGILTIDIDTSRNINAIFQQYQRVFDYVICEKPVKLFSGQDHKTAIDTAIAEFNEGMNGSLKLHMNYRSNQS